MQLVHSIVNKNSFRLQSYTPAVLKLPGSSSPAVSPWRGGGKQRHDRQDRVALEVSRGLAWLDLPQPAAATWGCREPHASRCRAPQHAETLKITITTHFQFAIMKPKVDHDSYFEWQLALGCPAEAGTGLPTPWEAAAGCVNSQQAPAPLQSRHDPSDHVAASPYPLRGQRPGFYGWGATTSQFEIHCYTNSLESNSPVLLGGPTCGTVVPPAETALWQSQNTFQFIQKYAKTFWWFSLGILTLESVNQLTAQSYV